MQGVTNFVAFVALATVARGAPLRGRVARPGNSMLKLGNVTAKVAVENHTVRAGKKALTRAERARTVRDYVAAASLKYATPMEAFQVMDANQNQWVSPAEWSKEATKLQLGAVEGWSGLQEMDGDSDGFLSEAEFFTATSQYQKGNQWIVLPPLEVTTTYDAGAVDRDYIADSTTATTTTTTTVSTIANIAQAGANAQAALNSEAAREGGVLGALALAAALALAT